MRRIVFRGKRTDTGAWVYGNLLTISNGYSFIDTNNELYEDESYIFRDNTDMIRVAVSKVSESTVGQFTGLHDNTKWEDISEEEQNIFMESYHLHEEDWKGREIFEGDILLIDEVWDGETGSVKIYNTVGIKDGCFGYIGENSGELIPFCYNKVTEVVAGNIHDNPELLKGGKE